MAGLQHATIIATSEYNKAQRVKRIFEAYNATVRVFPLITTCPANDRYEKIRADFQKLKPGDWLAFTSANGVAFFMHWMHHLQLQVHNQGFRFAAIGGASAQRLRQEGIVADFTAENGDTARNFGKRLLRVLGKASQRVWIPKGNLASGELAAVLGEKHQCMETVVYNTIRQTEASAEWLRTMQEGKYDMIILLSPSAVETLLQLAQKHGLNPQHFRTAVIGPTTRKALEQQGLTPDFMPSAPNLDIMAAEMNTYFNAK